MAGAVGGGSRWGPRWAASASAFLAALSVAALAVVTNLATTVVPDSLPWLKAGAVLWPAVGMLTVLSAVLAAWAARASGSPGALRGPISHPPLLRRLRRLFARRAERERQAKDQQLALRVQDVLVGCGLSQTDRMPQVVSVVAGPPVQLKIRTLPGQKFDDFTAHLPAIAYNLGVAQVRLIPLAEPSLIQLDLLP